MKQCVKAKHKNAVDFIEDIQYSLKFPQKGDPELFSTIPASSQIHRPWLGDKVDPGIGLSYRPDRLLGLAGRHDNPMPELTLSPCQGSMNSATGLLTQTFPPYWKDEMTREVSRLPIQHLWIDHALLKGPCRQVHVPSFLIHHPPSKRGYIEKHPFADLIQIRAQNL